jgi:hydroxyacylglutathione hydrolase
MHDRLIPLVDEGLGNSAYLLDHVRPVAAYAAGHIPGSVSIPLRAQYATWLGWLLPPDAPIVIVRDPGQDADDILWLALNIGYTRIVGELAGGVAAWAADGGELRGTQLVKPDGLDTPVVVDVRQHSEHATGHLPHAELIELGDLADHTADLPSGPATVMCGHGERAATAASILERAGRTKLSIMVGGPADWATATGHTLDTRQ